MAFQNPYYTLAQSFSFISPTIYKSRFYKNFIHLTKENVFERNIEPELLWLKDFLSQKAIFFDIGVGLGNYLYYLDYQLFPENIFAFEPQKKFYKRLKNLFPKMNIYPLALNKESQTKGELFYPRKFKEDFLENSTIDNNLIIDDDDTQIITQKVEISTLDDWAKKQELLKIDLIKIDCNGQEINIIEGAKDVLSQFSPTLMLKMLPKYYPNLWDNIQKVESLGYKAHYYHREHFILEPLTEKILHQHNTNLSEQNSRYISNIIFINH